ncbi:hypothetical protein [Kosakonia sp. MUSA4]|uniref:hypothetical protein n=1 Tax=Kosakonia sp. MUSA4 TaxID=2067958 RepID=UPI001597DF01|nr:hypothetical protein [Kosakonia sp. MUSA4]QJT81127.1 hypothetical protein C0557_14120 [Kosakonia sp. MUSA4]
MRILGKNIKSNIFNDSFFILEDWNKIYRKTLAIQHTSSARKNAHQDKLILIHTLRFITDNNSPFLNDKAEDLFATWDIISTSLTRLQSSMYDRNQWADVGLILAVPPQNIIGTFHKDVCFPNHAGNTSGETKNSYALSESYFKGASRKPNDPKMKKYLKSAMPDKTYATMMSPESLMAKSNGIKHNEVLIVGKKDVNTYAEFPPTDRVKVCGIYFQYERGQQHKLQQYQKNRELIEKLKQHNPDLPVIEHSVWGGEFSAFSR